VLPSDCGTSVGNNDLAKLAYLIDCSEGPDEDTGPTDCDWWTTPPPPRSKGAKHALAGKARALRKFERSRQANALRDRVRALTR
jgi:hypothetical protein